MTSKSPEAVAMTLLLRQPLAGAYALHFWDCRHIITDGAVLFDAIASYEARTGQTLPSKVEGLSLRYGSRTLLLYENRNRSRARINWTIAHELGHILLQHTAGTAREEREADRFAAAFLLPEAVIRYLDCRLGRPLTPSEMLPYFGASLSACRRRRRELDNRPPQPISKEDLCLLRRLFLPEEEKRTANTSYETE